MGKVILVCGKICSGKSYYSKIIKESLNGVIISPDEATYELINNKNPHDVRLVYLACAWLITHRGHFLNNLNVEKLDEIMDISSVYQNFINYFINFFLNP